MTNYAPPYGYFPPPDCKKCGVPMDTRRAGDVLTPRQQRARGLAEIDLVEGCPYCHKWWKL